MSPTRPEVEHVLGLLMDAELALDDVKAEMDGGGFDTNEVEMALSSTVRARRLIEKEFGHA